MAGIHIAEHCGLCAGAEKSIATARAALREAEATGRPVVLHKEILHNATVMEDLLSRGALCVDNIDAIPANALVVVRAHGEGKAFYDAAAERGLELRDATCANVRAIHELVRDARAAGKSIVILGKRGHAETEGTNGWCGGSAVILENDGEVAAMEEPAADTVFAVCQTTIARATAERLLALLRERFPEKTVEFRDTVCAAPLRIHGPSVRLAERCDVLFTIGGAQSSNTAELRKRCAAAGVAECPPQMDSCARFLDYLKANRARITPEKTYGFTAGASTPRAEVEKCRDLLAFWLYYTATKERLQGKIERFNSGFAEAGGSGNRILRGAAGHFAAVNGGGKYLRGVLANLGYRLAGGRTEGEADALSLAFEIFQTAVLIHDDLIDHAATRRGAPTVPRRYGAYDAGTADAMALCLGDWGMFGAVELLSGAYGAHPRFGALLRTFSGMIAKTVQGEIIDTALPFEQRTGISRESGEALVSAIREIHHLKTCLYTTIGPLVCGMILGGAPESDIAVMREFADALGAAFQIQDDLLGVFGDSEALGKDVGSDVSEYKQTLLYAYAREGDPALFQELLQYYGKENLTAAEMNRVCAVFAESGARAKTVAAMNSAFARARGVLDGAVFLSADDLSILRGTLLYLSLRDN